mmetsp:Transcript_110376/g.165168  ORF Transcript_110376/g.165168 Transcript_110376/m.165168 type:complete len:95 (+) Transcript_110376:1512-1796(+)
MILQPVLEVERTAERKGGKRKIQKPTQKRKRTKTEGQGEKGSKNEMSYHNEEEVTKSQLHRRQRRRKADRQTTGSYRVPVAYCIQGTIRASYTV